MQHQLLDIPKENQLFRNVRRMLAWNIVTSTVTFPIRTDPRAQYYFLGCCILLVLRCIQLHRLHACRSYVAAIQYFFFCPDGHDDFFNGYLDVWRLVSLR